MLVVLEWRGFSFSGGLHGSSGGCLYRLPKRVPACARCIRARPLVRQRTGGPTRCWLPAIEPHNRPRTRRCPRLPGYAVPQTRSGGTRCGPTTSRPLARITARDGDYSTSELSSPRCPTGEGDRRPDRGRLRHARDAGFPRPWHPVHGGQRPRPGGRGCRRHDGYRSSTACKLVGRAPRRSTNSSCRWWHCLHPYLASD